MQRHVRCCQMQHYIKAPFFIPPKPVLAAGFLFSSKSPSPPPPILIRSLFRQMPIRPHKPNGNPNRHSNNKTAQVPRAFDGGNKEAVGVMNKGIGGIGSLGLPGALIGHSFVLSEKFQKPCHGTPLSHATALCKQRSGRISLSYSFFLSLAAEISVY
jgi:hypothetical protein